MVNPFIQKEEPTGARSPVPKVKWIGGRDGGATAICASGGEALNVVLLMPDGERANREGLSQGISNYYCSPGRLAVFRRKFESVTCRTGADPATFTTGLEILTVRGSDIWVLVSETGWSGTGLLRTNGVVGCDVT